MITFKTCVLKITLMITYFINRNTVFVEGQSVSVASANGFTASSSSSASTDVGYNFAPLLNNFYQPFGGAAFNGFSIIQHFFPENTIKNGVNFNNVYGNVAGIRQNQQTIEQGSNHHKLGPAINFYPTQSYFNSNIQIGNHAQKTYLHNPTFDTNFHNNPGVLSNLKTSPNVKQLNNKVFAKNSFQNNPINSNIQTSNPPNPIWNIRAPETNDHQVTDMWNTHMREINSQTSNSHSGRTSNHENLMGEEPANLFFKPVSQTPNNNNSPPTAISPPFTLQPGIIINPDSPYYIAKDSEEPSSLLDIRRI